MGPHWPLICCETPKEKLRDPRVTVADKQIAEIGKLGDHEAATSFGDRLEKLVQNNPGEDRAEG